MIGSKLLYVARAKQTRYPVTPEWVAAAERRLEQLGINKNDLSKRLKVSYATVHNLLSGVRAHSTVVPQMHKILGWPAPGPINMSSDIAELQYIYDRLTEEQREMIINLAKQLSKNK